MEMIRSVSQLLFSYLPDRTVSWEDGAGIVRLGTPRLKSAWRQNDARFVLEEISQYLARWRVRGEVDARFPPPSQVDRFTVGTPQGISASVLTTAYYCRRCFRFFGSPKGKLRCPDCRSDTLRQIGYVFVHGCGELVPIKDTIPQESSRTPGSIWQAPIRCTKCGEQGVLRLDARSERLSALKVVCRSCGTEVVGRPLARCPHCLPRLFGGDDWEGGQLAFRTAMRITRFSANNAYYPHAVTILRLDRPRVVQRTEKTEWLQGLLPAVERRPAQGVAAGLSDLVARLADAEGTGDAAAAADIREAIGRLVEGEDETGATADQGVGAPELEADVSQAVRESIALLSSVRRTSVRDLSTSSSHDHKAAQQIAGAMGLQAIELVEGLPVVTAVFGYTRRSQESEYQEEGAVAPFPATLRPFPVLDDEAARILGNPMVAGTTPILAREGMHEGLALYLEPRRVLDWLSANDLHIPGGDEPTRLRTLLERLEPVDRFHDEIDALPLRRMVFGLIHSLSHCTMRALARTSGIEETSLAEYLFLPLLGTVVYSTANTNLGGVRAAAKERMVEVLETLQEEAMRCLYDPDCLHRRGACHGCIHVPEISCRVFNHGLSRSFLVGGRAPWLPPEVQGEIQGFWRGPSEG